MNSDLDNQQKIKFRRVAIIGTGLLGASLGGALKYHDLAEEIVGIGRRQETIDKTVQLGYADRGTTVLKAGIIDTDLIVVATPLGTIEHIFEQIADSCKSSVDTPIVTDVGSTKVSVCLSARKHLMPKEIRFIGSHPMAGGEKQGPEHARTDLFDKAPCVVVGDDADPVSLHLICQLWRELGCHVITMSAEAHDQSVSRISHLPHMIATSLIHLANHRNDWLTASSGFRDTTRLASGGADIWRDILLNNSEPIHNALDDMISELRYLQGILAEKDAEKIYEWLAQGRDLRQQWLDNNGIEGR